MARKFQYQAISRTIFVATAPIAVFSSFSQPLPVKANIAVETAGVVNAPISGRPAPAVFSQFSRPQTSRPNIAAETSGAVNAPVVAPTPSPIFSHFSQPQTSRFNPNEQPSTLFEILPPQVPPFTGFAQFGILLQAESRVDLHLWKWPAIFLPSAVVDTHDGGWFSKRKRKQRRDPIEGQIKERTSRREALENAIRERREAFEARLYRRPITVQAPPVHEPEAIPLPSGPPPDVSELASLILKIQNGKAAQERQTAAEDDEADLEIILREIL